MWSGPWVTPPYYLVAGQSRILPGILESLDSSRFTHETFHAKHFLLRMDTRMSGDASLSRANIQAAL